MLMAYQPVLPAKAGLAVMALAELNLLIFVAGYAVTMITRTARSRPARHCGMVCPHRHDAALAADVGGGLARPLAICHRTLPLEQDRAWAFDLPAAPTANRRVPRAPRSTWAWVTGRRAQATRATAHDQSGNAIAIDAAELLAKAGFRRGQAAA